MQSISSEQIFIQGLIFFFGDTDQFLSIAVARCITNKQFETGLIYSFSMKYDNVMKSGLQNQQKFGLQSTQPMQKPNPVYGIIAGSDYRVITRTVLNLLACVACCTFDNRIHMLRPASN
jgi:mitochondrial fission protein ELM1